MTIIALLNISNHYAITAVLTVSNVYFRRSAEVRHAEIISARLGSTWQASVLDKENIAVLKQFY